MKNHILLRRLLVLLIASLSAGIACAPTARAADTGYAMHAPLALRKATPNSVDVPRFGLFELTLDLSASYADPFDPGQIDVGADFTGPDGQVTHVNGFLYQDFTRSLSNGVEILTEAGAPVWKVRFAPSEIGDWHYVVSARDSSGSVHSKSTAFHVTTSDNPGFVHVSKRNPHVFAFDGEKPYFPVGEDMCWAHNTGSYGYEDWMAKLHESGGNWVRLWMTPNVQGGMSIEWTPGASGTPDYGSQGVGTYNLAHAWRLDKVLDIADADDLYCMVTLGTSGEFGAGPKPLYAAGSWATNPYNSLNGGPCATPADFWTNADAQKLYRQRLRYILARYGWRTTIQSWEFWNETDAPLPWLKTMSDYVKGLAPYAGHPADPYRHLVTTTYATNEEWCLPEIDWTQTHLYGDNGNVSDMAPVIAADGQSFQRFDKPHMDSEFGIDFRAPDTSYDPDGKGVDLHNGLWAAAVSGDAGGAMIWWWDEYIAPKDLYSQFAPLAKVVRAMPWTAGPWKAVAADPVVIPPDDVAGKETFSDLVLPASAPWGRAAAKEYTVGPGAAGVVYPSSFFGPAKVKEAANYSPSYTFDVDFPQAGQFSLHAGRVSDSTSIDMILDGKIVRTLRFDANPPKDQSAKPDYKKTTYEDAYHVYLADFDRDYSIDVPAGKHTIEIRDTGGDWMEITSYRLTNYHSSRYPAVSVTGVARDGAALLWVHNLDHNWHSVLHNTAIPTIHDAKTDVPGLPNGAYAVQWIDTNTGDVTRTDHELSTVDGALPLSIPDLGTDIAVKITPVK